MNLRTDDVKRTARAPAKLNLFLEITGRRVDGFHELETLIVPIRLADTLSLRATNPAAGCGPGKITLNVRNLLPLRPPRQSFVLPTDDNNLVVRALTLLQQRSKCCFGAGVDLVKRIPVAAGLGGGSSDAAAALRLANRAWQLNWPNERLAELAAELGSDVPFFLSAGAAVCRGRGEQVEPLRGMPPLHFVVVKPEIGLSTSEVYRAHDVQPSSTLGSMQVNQFIAELASARRSTLRHWLHNRLQAAAASLSPWVNRLHSVFDELDCVGHILSGSGSAYFGVCRHAQHARRLASNLRSRQLGLVYATRSCQ
jgi:4-diphosphocytidyl-2-C-methyl-D-erythritol kinase